MKMPNGIMRSTAIAALLSVPFATGAAFAQETNQSGQANQTQQTGQANQTQQTGQANQTQQTDQSQGSTTQASDGTSQSAAGSDQAGNGQQQDAVLATVGGTEIRGSDLMTVIGALPPELQSQPPQMLVPMALEQLILRELILEEARSQNLASDPEVVALVESSTRAAEDDAMVQVWLDREMSDAVTDEAVQQTYDQAQAEGQQNLPPIEEVRPQIEQFLRQQAMQDIQTQLRQDADVVFYDPTGRPIEQQTDAQQGQASQGSGNNTGSNIPGTNNTGTNNTGTNNTGGNNTGGNNSGTNNSGGSNTGGNNSGTNNSGGNNSGGNNSGGSGSSD